MTYNNEKLSPCLVGYSHKVWYKCMSHIVINTAITISIKEYVVCIIVLDKLKCVDN